MNYLNDLIPEAEVCQLLDIKKQTLAAWRSRHKGPAWIAVGRRIFYPRVKFEAWLRSNEVDPTPVANAEHLTCALGGEWDGKRGIVNDAPAGPWRLWDDDGGVVWRSSKVPGKNSKRFAAWAWNVKSVLLPGVDIGSIPAENKVS